jgi:hypothetical protein|tara:strand:- start:1131 stop:1316 length:186 start_codon:yes stop_codon:yes gene_type:complete
MTISEAKYVEFPNFDGTKVKIGVRFVVDGVISVAPLTLENTDYAEIMRQVDAGKLTIAAAD